MHTSSGDHYYCAEADQRRYYYPPPYWYNNSWYYAFPWLWYDGNKHGSYQYAQWEAKITARMAIPAPFRAAMWGDYSPVEGSGTVYACFWNDSSIALTGRVQFIITEDSLYYVGTNGDPWHNHVARDYLPDHNGEVVSIPAGDSLILSRPFQIEPTWDETMCEIVSFIQDDSLQPDTIKEVWQGALIKVSELTGLMEVPSQQLKRFFVQATPNPCTQDINFSFFSAHASSYRITVYDITGRQVYQQTGKTTGTIQTLNWDLTDQTKRHITPGIYLYRLESGIQSAGGKMVVR